MGIFAILCVVCFTTAALTDLHSRIVIKDQNAMVYYYSLPNLRPSPGLVSPATFSIRYCPFCTNFSSYWPLSTLNILLPLSGHRQLCPLRTFLTFVICLCDSSITPTSTVSLSSRHNLFASRCRWISEQPSLFLRYGSPTRTPASWSLELELSCHAHAMSSTRQAERKCWC